MDVLPEDGKPRRMDVERLRASAEVYASCFCEENVARALAVDGGFALFISNTAREVAIAGQRSGAPPDFTCVWDYHVVRLALEGDRAVDGAATEEGASGAAAARWLVYDLDSRLAFPIGVAEYLAAAFPPVPERYRPAFRLVGASHFLANFSSTRRHMRAGAGGIDGAGSDEGAWLASPPSWPCFRGSSALLDHNLPAWLPGGSEAAGFGEEAVGVSSLLELLSRVRVAREAL